MRKNGRLALGILMTPELFISRFATFGSVESASPLVDQVTALILLVGIGMGTLTVFRKLTIPYTVILVAIGMILREGMELWPQFRIFESVQPEPEAILFILLPVLIFESGLNLDARRVFRNLPPTLTMAIPALFLSTAMIGAAMWWGLEMDAKMALVFGALISATDPVAVIAIFRELGAPKRLMALVEGESLLNDATAIVLFHLLLGLSWSAGFSWMDGGEAIGEFLFVFFGGALVGGSIGWVGSRILARIRNEASAVVGVSCVLAYFSFMVGEHWLHVSGIMAAAGSAMTLSALGSPVLGKGAHASLESSWEFLALVCNTLLFLFVGLMAPIAELVLNAGPILFAVLVVQLSRAVLVYTLPQWASRQFGLPDISLGERHIIFWGGLKGGLAIAMALSIPEEIPGRVQILNLTLGVVIFTLLVNATTIRPLIQWLGLTQLTQDEKAQLTKGATQALEQADKYLNRFRRIGILSRSGHHRTRNEMNRVLGAEMNLESAEADKESSFIELLQIEMDSLKSFYHAGVIPQALYLDLQNELRKELDQVRKQVAPEIKPVTPFFGWLERLTLKRFREKNWAIPWMARYQNSRVARRMMRLMTRLILTQTALEEWEERYEDRDEEQNRVLDHYQSLQNQRLQEVETVREDFPEFFASFEARMALKTALSRALVVIEEEWNRGGIDSRAFAILENRISDALDQARIEEKQPVAIGIEHFIEIFPLFENLPQEARERITRMATRVEFLANDIIIGQGDSGDALYIIAKGKVQVSRITRKKYAQSLATLGPGDFFGETALLGASRRTATVKALTACVLVRITRESALRLGREFPQIGEKLNDAKTLRAQQKKEAKRTIHQK